MRGRIERVRRALEAEPQDEALSRANSIVHFLVECDLIHEACAEPRALIERAVSLWKRYAAELGVPDDGSARDRILATCARLLRPASPGRATGLVERLKKPARTAG